MKKAIVWKYYTIFLEKELKRSQSICAAELIKHAEGDAKEKLYQICKAYRIGNFTEDLLETLRFR